MILSKVKAFKDGLQTVQLSKESKKELIKIDLNVYKQAAGRLVKGIQKAGYDDPNLAVYVQCVHNYG
jgi:hypothetical protein